MRTTPPRWEDVLDDLEAELLSARSTAPADLIGPAPFEPPPGLGPLPDALHARATALLRLIEDTTTLIEQSMADVRRSTTVATQLSGRAPRPASTVDLSA